jgi:S-adenosylmethionine synthetase
VPLFHGPESVDGRFGRGRWAACFGGDPFNEAKPDIAVLVQRLQSKHQMKLIAIQADKVQKEWGGVDKHIDVVYYYPTEYLEDGKTVAWGGLKGGRPVGTTRILLEVNPCSGLPLQWIAAGGGDITLNELRAAWDHDISILYIEALARLPQDPSQPCGPCKQYWDSMQDYQQHGFFRSSSSASSSRPVRTRSNCQGWRVLITGATGLLGREVLREFEERGWLAYGCGFSRATGRVRKCDLLQSGEFEQLLEDIKPLLVIHCAAERRPDVLESDKDYATKVNVGITGDIGKLCKARGIWMIYLSTNYVFDGKAAPYAEDAVPHPVNTYGHSKLAGEQVLKEVFPEAAIVRIPLLYGPIEYLEETSVTTLLTTIQKDASAKLDNWQERFPTCSSDVARVLEVMAASYMGGGSSNPERLSGIFHWQADERHTKYTMALAIAEIANVDSEKFVAVNDAPAPSQAPRPQYEQMLCSQLEGILKEEGPVESFRSNFKASLRRHLRPFLKEGHR